LKTGLFGGSFDPVHNGHLAIARASLDSAGLDRVVFLPESAPPHKPGRRFAPSVHRLAMLQLAIEGEPRFALSAMNLDSTGPCYTIDTWRRYREEHPAEEARFIIGGDMLADLPNWHRPADLLREVDFVICSRPGFCADEVIRNLPFGEAERMKLAASVIEAPLLDISASHVRELAACGGSLSAFVPPSVAAYITANSLYGSRC